MRKFKIKPKKGLLIRDPETLKPLKAAGEVKPRDEFWLRRIQDGSVTEMTTKTTKKQETES